MCAEARRSVIVQGVSVLLALAGTTPLLPQARGQQVQAERAGDVLPIKNARFALGPDDVLTDWKFESLAPATDSDAVSRSKGDALLLPGKKGQGAALQGTTETARGDLVSRPLPLKPFRWIEVGVEYTVESGEPLVFVCLRPTKHRARVDLEFLPKTPKGEKRRALVRLHSGSLDGDYSISFSIVGVGTARVFSLDAREKGDYPRPERSALVIDLVHATPATEGPNRWAEIYRLTSVYGFPGVEVISYTQVTPDKLKALNPGLVVLWPYVDRSENPDRQKVLAATRTAAHCGAPLIGVGLGHQVLAQAEKNVQMTRMSESGPTRLEVVADDPIFAGLPRAPYFFAAESHVGIVRATPPGAEVIATSEKVLTQAFRYPGQRWYTFQANLERDWEYACPEACLVWKNMLRVWGLAPPAGQGPMADAGRPAP
jgi:GMP synthase-like glutamine amidotransferase